MNEKATLPDYLRHGLSVVFVGINPGEYSVRKGHYYARPTNKFWALLSKSRLAGQELTCQDDSHVPDLGIGLTDVVKRPTRAANELRVADYREGAPVLLGKLRKYRPRIVAFNGVTGYRNFRRALGNIDGRPVRLGRQVELLEGAEVFVLPSTSPANAGLSAREKLRYFRELARWMKRHCRDSIRSGGLQAGRIGVKEKDESCEGARLEPACGRQAVPKASGQLRRPLGLDQADRHHRLKPHSIRGVISPRRSFTVARPSWP